MPGTTVKMDQRGLHVLLRSERGAVHRDITRLTHKIAAKAKRKVGVDTGRLRSSINGEVSERSGKPVGRIGTNVEYAIFHHEGHGPIVPVRARVLVFTPKGSKQPVFTKYVRPVRGNPFLTEALREALVENV